MEGCVCVCVFIFLYEHGISLNILLPFDLINLLNFTLEFLPYVTFIMRKILNINDLCILRETTNPQINTNMSFHSPYYEKKG